MAGLIFMFVYREEWLEAEERTCCLSISIILTFKEEAAEYGLADTSYSTQAVFFDYDKDGRLDMYLLNHTLNDNRPNDIRDKKVDSNAIAGDKLYHNEGIPAGMNHPVFKDVSKKAGIIEDGNGLGSCR